MRPGPPSRRIAVGVVDPGPGSVVMRASTIAGAQPVWPAVFEHTSAGGLAQPAAMDSASLGGGRALIDDRPWAPRSQLSTGQ